MKNTLPAIGLVALGGAICAAGIYVGETDDAPGAAVPGIVLLTSAVVLAAKLVRGRTSPPATRS